jgi:MFS family permease
MESYCVFLMGSFVAMDQFQKDFGVVDKEGGHAIEAKWQSALQAVGPLGAIIGVCLAGPLTSRIGYRWATIVGLMFLNAFIFIFYFAKSLPVMFVAQLLEGIPWGIFIANAPAYCSEIVPIKLRAPATQMLQMFWAIGSIIVGGICYVYQSKVDSTSYRFVPFFGVTSRSSPIDKTQNPGSPSRSSGCFPPRLPSSFSLLPSRLGGWFERDVSSKLQLRFDALGARRFSPTRRNLWL